MKRLTTSEFIEKAKAVHGDKYDYSKCEYVNNRTKVCIICPEHGEFWQEPGNHLKGYGCNLCAIKKRGVSETYDTKRFVEKAIKVHGNRYDYSETVYNGCYKKVRIICPEHGVFTQSAASHIQGCGCPKCCKNKKYDTREWIEKAISVHGDKYDYSKCIYDGAKTKVKIICHEKDKYGNEHGEFLQLPNNHINGSGCPKCREFKLETEIRNLLIENKIRYEEHKTFEWLKNGSGAKTLDFYLVDYNSAIECQGIQHFRPTDFANGGEKWANNKFNYTLKNDEFKRKECERKGIKVYYFSNLGLKYPYIVFENKNKLLEQIKNDGTNHLQSGRTEKIDC